MLLLILDYIGVFAFAISGVMLAIYKKFDLYGAFTLAAAVAVGGGITRDVILGSTPPAFFQDANYLYIIIAAIVFCYALYRSMHHIYKYVVIFDALGLGVFVVIGTQKGFDMGMNWYTCILMGVITATGGGMIRDILAGDTPFVLRKEVYASAALVGGAAYYVGLISLDPQGVAIIALQLFIITFIVALRLGTYFFNINLNDMFRAPALPDDDNNSNNNKG